MERRRNFYELSQSLSSGFFADRVMMMLSRIRSTKRLGEDDQKTLSLVQQFFEDVLAGYRWSDEPRFSGQSLKFANSFSQAIHAITFSPHASVFENYIKKLLAIVKDIKEQNLQDKEIEELKDFFYNYSKSQFHRTHTILTKTSLAFR